MNILAWISIKANYYHVSNKTHWCFSNMNRCFIFFVFNDWSLCKAISIWVCLMPLFQLWLVRFCICDHLSQGQLFFNYIEIIFLFSIFLIVWHELTHGLGRKSCRGSLILLASWKFSFHKQTNQSRASPQSCPYKFSEFLCHESNQDQKGENYWAFLQPKATRTIKSS
jgi:hypothetical protein